MSEQKVDELSKPCLSCGVVHGSVNVHFLCLESEIVRLREELEQLNGVKKVIDTFRGNFIAMQCLLVALRKKET